LFLPVNQTQTGQAVLNYLLIYSIDEDKQAKHTQNMPLGCQWQMKNVGIQKLAF
jgi:hypothetical protein